MAQTTAGDHRHETAAGCDHRAKHQGDNITHTAGGVLVDNRATQIEVIPGQYHAGVAHGAGQGNPLIHGHVFEVDRHRQGGNLPLTDGVVGNALNEELNFLGTERFTVALLANNFLRQKHLSFPPPLLALHKPESLPTHRMVGANRADSRPPSHQPISNRWCWPACRHAQEWPADWPAGWMHQSGRYGRIPSRCRGSLRPWPGTDRQRRHLSRHQLA